MQSVEFPGFSSFHILREVNFDKSGLTKTVILSNFHRQEFSKNLSSEPLKLANLRLSICHN